MCARDDGRLSRHEAAPADETQSWAGAYSYNVRLIPAVSNGGRTIVPATYLHVVRAGELEGKARAHDAQLLRRAFPVWSSALDTAGAQRALRPGRNRQTFCFTTPARVESTSTLNARRS